MKKNKEQESFNNNQKESDRIKEELKQISKQLKAEGKPSAHIDDTLNVTLPTIKQNASDSFVLKDDTTSVLDKVRGMLPNKSKNKLSK
jgi:transcriptional regulator with AAA-type ATPase domain